MTAGDGPVDLLVLEPAERGHGLEWMLHLARHAGRSGSAGRLAFAVAPVIAGRLREALAAPPEGPTIFELTDREVALCTHRGPAVSGIARWSIMRRHLRASGARHGLFLEFDHLSLPLALGLPLPRGRSVSGVLFRPSVHYANGRPRPTERLRDLRKEVLYRRMLRHPALGRLHSLDDAFPAFARRRYGGGDKVTALVDPAFPPVDPGAADRALAERAPAGRRLLVLFGVLSARKGVLALLRALAALDPATARRAAVIVAGAVDPAIAAEVEAAVAALTARQTGLWLHLEDRRLAAGEIAALVDRADVVLAPYQRFVGSSGVLMWAASRGRPVITQDYGLVGRLVREHGLGLAVDTTRPVALARAISAAVDAGADGLVDPARLADFAAARTANAFAAAILDPVLRRPPPERKAAAEPAAAAAVASVTE